MEVHAIIFNLDGVLVDTSKYHYLAWKKLASTLGIELNDEQQAILRKLGRMEALDYILGMGKKDVSEEEKKRMATRKNGWYQESILHLKASEVLPGVHDFIQDARDHGFKLAVASSSKNAKLVLDRTMLTHLFDAVSDGMQVTKPIPDPQVFEIACQKLGVSPSNTLVFEDAERGVEAAKRAGCLVVGVGDAGKMEQADLRVKNLRAKPLRKILIALRDKEGVTPRV